MDCIFCKIIAGEIPSNKLYEDDEILAFHDISPMAPVHVLVIPKTHYDSVDTLDDAGAQIVAKIVALIPKLAKQQGLGNGYRVVTNVGENGGQTVKHLHFHLLGGKKLNTNLA